jgi:hypothetical protein
MADAALSPAQELAGEAPAPLLPGERVALAAAGVRLGWQPRTILIWWLPGLAFIAVGQLEFRSWAVTAGLALFCAALFAFYAQDREVRPRGGSRRYLLTDRRLLIGSGADAWRPVPLADVARTEMEHGIADLAVARLSGAATIVLVLATPGPKGEPRRLRIGPMRDPETFRAAIDARLGEG